MKKIREACSAWLCSIVLLGGGAVPAAASTACDADKLEATGAYAACRLDADAKALETGRAADYSNCDNKLAKDLVIAERKSRGTCLAAADFQAIQTLVAGYAGNMADVVAPADDGCPPEYANRTLVQVVDDLWSAVVQDDAEAIACNLHEDAFFINDQAVLVGRTMIAESLRSLTALFGYAAPDFAAEDQWEDTIRVRYSLDGGWIVIPDGIDTYVIEAGKIRKATQHGLIEFTGPPDLIE
jgi:hypothetical protein